MDKKQALAILIKHSFLLTQEEKIQLLGRLPQMSDQEINDMGRFMAKEKTDSVKYNKMLIANEAKVLQQFDKAVKKAPDSK